MLIRNAEVEGVTGVDVRLAEGRIERVDARLVARPGEATFDARGGALLPGLHDHHLHLLSLAAALESVGCGPPAVRSRDGLRNALARARPSDGGAVRAVGYHESVAGPLDRHELDALRSDVPIRLQHRSGALWILNSAAIAELGGAAEQAPDGAERDAAGQLTGRFFRLDGWLQRHSGKGGDPPGLEQVGRLLAASGVTGVTDATPGNDARTLAWLEEAVRSGALPQHVVVMGGAALPRPQVPGLSRGPLKVMLDDDRLPELDALCDAIEAAHRDGRAVAFHCVTRVQGFFAAEALRSAGPREGDRIEHAAVAPPDLLALLREIGVTVVTQPNFILERGDVYAVDVDPRDRPWLYRGRGFDEAGVALGGGTDAPFGDPDPWRAIRAAVDRRSEGGRRLGADEGLSPERALQLFTTPYDAPGGPPRRIRAGAPGDLCLLRTSWRTGRLELRRELVRAAFRGDRCITELQD